MKEVTVNKKELLDRVQLNRKDHRDLFLEAQKGYRKAVIKELDEMLKDARDGSPIRVQVQLVEPQDHTDDYDRIIDMLEMSTDEKIVLNSREFENYVRDSWDWTAFAAMTNSSYTSQ